MSAVPSTLWSARPTILFLVPFAVLLLLLAGFGLFLAGFGAAPAGPPAGPTGPLAGPPPALPAGASAEEIVAGFSDEELVGQVLMPYVYGDHATGVPEPAAWANQEYAGVATPAELVARYRVGGVILLRRTGQDGVVTPESNISSPAQVRELTGGLQAAAGVPLLIGIDQEYGVVARLTDGVTGLPSAMAFGAADDPGLTEDSWRVAGAELAALGVNVNFAPVADVLGGTRGGVIGSRSYGSDPALVAAQVAAVVRGLQGAGVAATLKHFPGHGGTAIDSHDELPVVAGSRRELDSRDLPPFLAGVAAGASLVMSGHLDVRSLDPGVPASFSHTVVTDLLRGELGFDGVAVTDGLNMAPAERWPAGEAAVRALLAGNDLLLMPPDLAGAYDGLLAALANGSLPRERLVEAASRVLTLKLDLAGPAKHAMPAGSPGPAGSSKPVRHARSTASSTPAGHTEPAGPAESVGNSEPAGHEENAASDVTAVASTARHDTVVPLAVAAVTLLRGPCAGVLVDGPVTVTAAGGRDPARGWLVEALADAGLEVVDSGGTVVHLVGYGDDASDLSDAAAVTVAMDTPYLLEQAESPVLLATYSSSRLSMVGLATVLAGHSPALGRSPVPLHGLPRSACDTE